MFETSSTFAESNPQFPMDPHTKNSAKLDAVVSIASIQLKNTTNKKKQSKICGEVMINGSNGLNFIYNRRRSLPETKSAGDFLTLTGPSSPISCLTETSVYLSLYDEDDDHEIAVGQFLAYFLGWSHVRSKFNRPLVIDFEAEHGGATVTYSVIEYALYASVAVVPILRREDSAKVYGKVVARQYFGEVDLWTSMSLFDRSVDEAARVAHGESLPLDRSLVEAPVNDRGSCLTVEVDLWIGDFQIGEGSFKYCVEYDAVFDPTSPLTKTFAGAGDGEVIVSITPVSNW